MITGGRNHADSVSAPRLAAIGRLKKPSRVPSDLIIELMKFSSSIPPRTTPRIAGAIGNLLASSQPSYGAQ